MEITTIAPFLDYFDRVRERTMRVVACIPPEKIEWRAAEGKFTLYCTAHRGNREV